MLEAIMLWCAEMCAESIIAKYVKDFMILCPGSIEKRAPIRVFGDPEV
jgi:hypothetical protein